MEKQKAKGTDAIKAEHLRLSKMSGGGMKPLAQSTYLLVAGQRTTFGRSRQCPPVALASKTRPAWRQLYRSPSET